MLLVTMRCRGLGEASHWVPGWKNDGLRLEDLHDILADVLLIDDNFVAVLAEPFGGHVQISLLSSASFAPRVLDAQFRDVALFISSAAGEDHCVGHQRFIVDHAIGFAQTEGDITIEDGLVVEAVD